MITQIRKGNQTIDIKLDHKPVILNPSHLPEDTDETGIVRASLENPIGSQRLRQIVKPGEKIAIITSDITRPMPTAKVLDPLMEELVSAGVSPKDVMLVFARGSHRHHSEEEMKKLAGKWYDMLRGFRQ